MGASIEGELNARFTVICERSKRLNGRGCDGMDITPEDFERFLAWLDPDPKQAAAKYIVIQTKLTVYFKCKGCGIDSEQLADETIARVSKTIPKIADTYVGERLPYFLGFARKVYSEWLRKMIRIRLAQPPPSPDSIDDKELLDRCLTRCLKKLTEKKRDLILRYYTGERQAKIEERKKLAEEEDLAPNALRIQAHRIRTQLRECVEKCVAEENDDEESIAEVNNLKEENNETD